MHKKAKIWIAQYAYAGNGGNSSLIPEMALWLARTYHRLMNDHRIDGPSVVMKIYSDTPIYMMRNRAVKEARESGYDMLLMLDSDNEPDAYYGHEPGAQRFFDEPFDFLYQRWLKGLPTFLAAPYCGPPPHPLPRPGTGDGGEVPFLFQWTNTESDSTQWKIEMISREHAAILRGIQPMACLPTGVSLSTLSVYNGPPKPYFDYEHDEEKTVKQSTEDCFATRNLSLYWHMTRGIEVCYAACDSWALHHKPKRVGRPKMPFVEQIAKEMRDVILNNFSGNVENSYVDYTDSLPPTIGFHVNDSPATVDLNLLPRRGQILRHDQNEVLITDEELEEARNLLDQRAGPPAVETAVEVGQVLIDERMTVDPDYATVATANDDGRSNGHPLMYRMIGGRKIATLTHEIREDDLTAIQALAAHAASKGPVEVAVAVAGSGQAAAAILEELPEGSHLYAMDCIQMHQFSGKPAEEFTKSFQKELESGRVMANINGRKFPWPGDKMHLDMVFIERSITEEKLQKWLDHVRAGGLLCGLGSVNMVREFASGLGLKFKNTGSVWAIQR